MSLSYLSKDSTYEKLMAQRTIGDQTKLKQYDCVQYQNTVSPSMVAMLSPVEQLSFQPVQMVNPSISYQLNPTAYSIQMAQNIDSKNNSDYPPRCGYQTVNPNDICKGQTPGPYYHLDQAYFPQSGSRYINTGQELNLLYKK